MFADKNEQVFYALAGVALAIAIWASGLFGLKGSLLAAALLLASYGLGVLLAHLGERASGKAEDSVHALLICGALAFALVVISNPGRGAFGSIALPITFMFLAPAILFYVRTVSKSGANVQPK